MGAAAIGLKMVWNQVDDGCEPTQWGSGIRELLRARDEMRDAQKSARVDRRMILDTIMDKGDLNNGTFSMMPSCCGHLVAQALKTLASGPQYSKWRAVSRKRGCRMFRIRITDIIDNK